MTPARTRTVSVTAHVRRAPANPAAYVKTHAELRFAFTLDELERELVAMLEEFLATGGLAL